MRMNHLIFVCIIAVLSWSALTIASDADPIVSPDSYTALTDGMGNLVSSTTTTGVNGGLGLNVHCTNCTSLTSQTIQAIASNGVILGQINTSIASNTASTSAAIGVSTNQIVVSVNSGTASTSSAIGASTNSIVNSINANTATTSGTANLIIQAVNSGSTIINNQIISASASNTLIVSAGTTAIVTAVNNNSASNTQAVSAGTTAIVNAINGLSTSGTLNTSGIITAVNNLNASNTLITSSTASLIINQIISATTGVKSVNNSRTTALGSLGTFTGTGEDVLKYQNITVTVFYNQAVSFTVQWSDDNSTWLSDGDVYTASPSVLKKSTYGRIAQYFRVVVTNLMATGAQGFTSVIFDSPRPKPSSHRIAESVSIESDAELTKGMIFGLNTAGTSTTIFRGTSGGSLFVAQSDTFTRIKSRSFFDTEEVLYDIPASVVSSFIYTGVAPSGTVSSTAAWSIIRTSFDSNGNPSRDQYRTGVSWTARASGW